MSGKEFHDQLKRILLQIPGINRLNSIRYKLIRVRELSDLIEKKRIIAFSSNSSIGNNGASTCSMTHEIMKELIDLYGVAPLRRSTKTTINAQSGSILLFAPQSLLGIPDTHDEYLHQVERETRRLIRLAERKGYEFKEFSWNDHLDEIYAINKSKDIRQREPMRGWYREPVQPRYHSMEDFQYRKYYGAFMEGKLFAYFHVWILNKFAIGKHIIGHADHLKYGIMNGLLSYAVKECIQMPQVQWLHYGVYNKGSLGSFKKRAGFLGYAILLDLQDDEELLNYSVQKVRTLWRI